MLICVVGLGQMVIEADDIRISEMIGCHAVLFNISLKPKHIGNRLNVGPQDISDVTPDEFFMYHKSADHQNVLIKFHFSLEKVHVFLSSPVQENDTWMLAFLSLRVFRPVSDKQAEIMSKWVLILISWDLILAHRPMKRREIHSDAVLMFYYTN